MVDLLRHGKVSPAQLIEALLVRIAATEPHQRRADALRQPCPRRRPSAGAARSSTQPSPGYLRGLPIVVKDPQRRRGRAVDERRLAHATHLNVHDR